MFDKQTKRLAALIAFGVLLYAAVMNFGAVSAAVGSVVNIFFPVLLGLGVAFVLNVPVSGVERMIRGALARLSPNHRPSDGVVTWASILITLACIAVVAILAVTMLAPELIASAQTIYPLLVERLPEIERGLSEAGIDIDRMLASIAQGVESAEAGGIEGLMDFGLGTVATSVFAAARSTASALTGSMFAFVISVYVLSSKRRLCRHANMVLDAHVDDAVAAKLRHVAALVTETYSKFLSGQCLEACILGSLIFIAFSIFNLPYAGLIGFLTAIFAFIPYVGAFASCAIGAFLTLLASPEQALMCIIVYVAVQFVENQFIYPHVVGSSVGLSALWTLIAALVGGNLFGVVGIVFFIPLVAVLYELAREWTYERLEARHRL